MESAASSPNTQLVESLIQVIQSLSAPEQALLLDKLLGEVPYPSTSELLHLAEQGGSFDFWHEEPDLYTSQDGEPVTSPNPTASFTSSTNSLMPLTCKPTASAPTTTGSKNSWPSTGHWPRKRKTARLSWGRGIRHNQTRPFGEKP